MEDYVVNGKDLKAGYYWARGGLTGIWRVLESSLWGTPPSYHYDVCGSDEGAELVEFDGFLPIPPVKAGGDSTANAINDLIVAGRPSPKYPVGARVRFVAYTLPDFKNLNGTGTVQSHNLMDYRVRCDDTGSVINMSEHCLSLLTGDHK